MPTTHTPLECINLALTINAVMLSAFATTSASSILGVLEALMSFTFVSACIRLVYTSLWVLPHTAQNSVPADLLNLGWAGIPPANSTRLRLAYQQCHLSAVNKLLF